MMLIDFIFLFNAIFDGTLKTRFERVQTKKFCFTQQDRCWKHLIVLNLVKVRLVQVKFSIYFHEDLTKLMIKEVPTVYRSFRRVDYLLNEFPNETP